MIGCGDHIAILRYAYALGKSHADGCLRTVFYSVDLARQLLVHAL